MFSLLLTLSACGRGRGNNEQCTEFGTRDISTHTLSILAPWDYMYVLQEAEQTMAAEWYSLGKNFSIDLTYYTVGQRDTTLTRLQIMIMAGQMPDIMMLDHTPWADTHSIRSFFTSGVFTDFYPLIDNDPHLSREDFYTNVLQAWEHEGRLYALPIAFGFEYVGINANMPRSIINRFASYETISMHQLLRVYLDLKELYGDEYGHYSIFSNPQFSSPFHVLSHSMNGFIDYENRRSHLNSSDFVALLDDWRQVFYGHGLMDFISGPGRLSQMGWYNRITPGRPDRLSPFRALANTATLNRYAQSYVFAVKESMLEPAHALIPHIIPHFLHFIPITDEQGRLRISHTTKETVLVNMAGSPLYPQIWGAGHWGIPMISASADADLAWEYVKHLISAFMNLQRADVPVHDYQDTKRSNTLVTPIMRDYFSYHVSHALENVFQPWHWNFRIPTFPTEDGQAQAIEAAIAKLAVYNEMPITSPFMIPTGLFVGPLDTFLRTSRGSVFGTYETAQELHNRVSLWLIE